MEVSVVKQPREIVKDGQVALAELKKMVTGRPDKLVINGRQYLYFSDWQTLGAFCDVTACVVETRELTREVPGKNGNYTLLEPTGYWARATARRNGQEISAAEAVCMFDEPNWKNKSAFQVLSMAQTRACAKVLRNCLSWIVRLPASNLSDEVAEEMVSDKPEQATF